VVSYHPDPDCLNALLRSLDGQVSPILIVDNTEPSATLDPALTDRPDVQIIHPGRNIGVAAAINRGIGILIEAGCRHALLLDQDSQAEPGMVRSLFTELERLEAGGHRTAAIGPRIRDQDTGAIAPFIRFALPFNKRLANGQGSVKCDFLITSGCLVNLAHWAAIGPMRESWFIDNIDLEWCFRARRRGFEIRGCLDSALDHRIGEHRRLAGLIPFRHHAPSRLYTMMRNRVFLYRSNAPRAWIIQDSLRAIGKLALFSLIQPRWQNLTQMLRGLRDGWRTRPVP